MNLQSTVNGLEFSIPEGATAGDRKNFRVLREQLLKDEQNTLFRPVDKGTDTHDRRPVGRPPKVD